MNRLATFQGKSHLEHIKKTLWSGKPYGRAAVMIGAGFSRNAKPTKVNAKQFPNWKQLAGMMYDELYPPAGPLDIEREKKKNSAVSGLGAIKVASEYERWFGRQKLDNLLVTSIPYDSYCPGKLHETLLSLPWSDIFTTNYDLLLEHTIPLVLDRNYGLVLTAQDIPRSKKPRVVKLHGSCFPSNCPFIVTEEDYRTYPVKFAPFVNLVQQSLMENTFCLIGFSGDDPNFLNWLGWVRDNLKEHTPIMYLCGVLDLSDSESKLLESRNVIPIDLSPIFPEEHYPDSGLRNAAAVEYFLNQLKLGEPPNMLDWPTMPVPSSGKEIGNNSRSWTTVVGATDNPEPIWRPERLDAEKLKQLMKGWKNQRLTYPGWLVCPGKNRDFLWWCTRYWIFDIVESLELLSPPDNLLLLRELNWRLEKALVPLLEIAVKLESVITTFNPFPALVRIDGPSLTPDNTSYGREDWEEIGKAWLELVFALIRNAREEFYPNIFRKWMDLIKDLVQRQPEWQSRYWHEECLYHLIRLDRKRVLETLHTWPTTFDSSIWQLRRAAIMAEVGQAMAAERLVEKALEQILRSRDPHVDDYCVLSQEGWARSQASLLARNRISRPREGVDPHLGRWSELSAFRCNPRAEMELMSATLDSSPPVPPPTREKRDRYGRKTVVYHFSNKSLFELRLPGFAFLRQFADGGLPVSCDFSGIKNTGTVNASRWIAPLFPVLAITFMVRNGNMNSVTQWFDFIKASALNDDQVREAAGVLMNSLQQALSALRKDPQQEVHMALRVIVTVPKLLAELCFRFNRDDREQLFRLSEQVYMHPVFGRGFELQESVGYLIKKMIEAMTEEEILDALPKLIGLPIPGERNFQVGYPSQWIEPLESISARFSSGLPGELDRSNWLQPIVSLIETVQHGSSFARTRAATRLGVLDNIGALTSEQRSDFAKALWVERNPVSGLPHNFLLPNNRFLSLPEPMVGEAKRAFRQWIVRQEFPRILVEATASGESGSSVNGKRIVINSIIDQILEANVKPAIRQEEANKNLVDWTAEEAAEILCRAVEWWRDNKQDLHDFEVLSDLLKGDRFRVEISKLVPLLGEIVLPRLPATNQQAWENALRLLDEMEQENISTSHAAPMTLLVDPDRSDKVILRLRHGLASSNAEEVASCIEGCVLWFFHSPVGRFPPFPPELLNELMNIVVGRRQPGLDDAIAKLLQILDRQPNQLSVEHLRLLCIGLDYLTKETELPVYPCLDINPNVHPTIPLLERRSFRQKAAALAYKIHSTLVGRELPIPQILLDWKEICEDDKFPEVRRSWPSGS